MSAFDIQYYCISPSCETYDGQEKKKKKKKKKKKNRTCICQSKKEVRFFWLCFCVSGFVLFDFLLEELKIPRQI